MPRSRGGGPGSASGVRRRAAGGSANGVGGHVVTVRAPGRDRQSPVLRVQPRRWSSPGVPHGGHEAGLRCGRDATVERLGRRGDRRADPSGGGCAPRAACRAGDAAAGRDFAGGRSWRRSRPRGSPGRVHLRSTEDRIRHARSQSSRLDRPAQRADRTRSRRDRPAGAPRGVRSVIRYASDIGLPLVPYGGGTKRRRRTRRPALDAPHGGEPPSSSSTSSGWPGCGRSTSRAGSRRSGRGGRPARGAALRERGRLLGHEPAVLGVRHARRLGRHALVRPALARLRADRGALRGRSVGAPAGTLEMPPHPASAAGPDPHASSCWVRRAGSRSSPRRPSTVPIPEYERTVAWFMPDWGRGWPRSGTRRRTPAPGDDPPVDPAGTGRPWPRRPRTRWAC